MDARYIRKLRKWIFAKKILALAPSPSGSYTSLLYNSLRHLSYFQRA